MWIRNFSESAIPFLNMGKYSAIIEENKINKGKVKRGAETFFPEKYYGGKEVK